MLALSCMAEYDRLAFLRRVQKEGRVKVALIPARSGSKRVPDKNIMQIGGKRLLEYSIDAALACDDIDDVYVSTDSEEYAKIAFAAGSKTILRPSYLATDVSTDLAVIKHFLEKMGDKAASIEQIIFLRPTTPLRKASVLELAMNDFDFWLNKSFPGPSSLRSVEEMSESAYKCFEICDNHRLKGISGYSCDDASMPNQIYRKTYKANGYIDIIRPDIIEHGKLWGDSVMAFKTDPVTEIDTMRELQLLQWEIQHGGGWDVHK